MNWFIVRDIKTEEIKVVLKTGFGYLEAVKHHLERMPDSGICELAGPFLSRLEAERQRAQHGEELEAAIPAGA